MDNIAMKPRKTVWELAHEAPKTRSGCPMINKSTKTHSNETRQGSFF
jgi:hypothetical protein